MSTYEKHIHEDPDFPIFFHEDFRDTSWCNSIGHWHESVEILLIQEGMVKITSDEECGVFLPGEAAVINADRMHTINTVQASCRYYCLIVDRDYLHRLGVESDYLRFPFRIRDDTFGGMIHAVAEEKKTPGEYRKLSVKLHLLSAFLYLAENYAESVSEQERKRSKRTELTRQTILYLNSHFPEKISTEDVARELGFSKSYLCHSFRDVMGQSVSDYLVSRRCANARSLLVGGTCNVGEAARRSGFENLSYFSRAYRKKFGILPSEEEKRNDLHLLLAEIIAQEYNGQDIGKGEELK